MTNLLLTKDMLTGGEVEDSGRWVVVIVLYLVFPTSSISIISGIFIILLFLHFSFLVF